MNIKIYINIPLLLACIFQILTCLTVFPQGAAINTTGTSADQSAMLDVSSTNSGILIPRMTKIQRSGISQPAEGLMIYQTDDTTGFWYYNGTSWKQIGSAAGSAISAGTLAGNTLYWNGTNWVESSNIYNTGGSVGIGTNNPEPTAKVEINSNNSGLLIPRMTTAERNTIGNPAEALQIFNTDTKCFEFYANGIWRKMCDFKCGFDLLFDSRDANNYQTIQIGSQCWMKEELKYLPIVHSNSEFAAQATVSQHGYGVWGYDGNNVSIAKSQTNYTTYGVLYNWHAAIIACPAGWHLPTDTEWQTLELYLSMDPSVINNTGWRGTNQGDQLKLTTLWTTGGSATNSSGFSAIPCGYRDSNGSFYYLSDRGFWWSASEDDSNAWRRDLYYPFSNINRGTSLKGRGCAVRCIMD